MSVRVRFAPSPTGPLHIGGVRTALYNYLFARGQGGTFILRIEDTDQQRYVEGAEDYIREALAWLGMQPEESPWMGGDYGPYRQSERSAIYQNYVQRLIDDGKAYYAFDTAEELAQMRTDKEAQGIHSPKYGYEVRSEMRNSLSLPDEQVRHLLDAGVPRVVRLKVDPGQMVSFSDIVRGDVRFSTDELDDKVLMKSDGLPTYHLANVVDDRLMKITHVIRGEEWLSSTPLHVLLYRAFGWEEEMPRFVHLPLILKPTGKGKLSKRDGAQSGFPVFPLQWSLGGETYAGFREMGFLPEAVVNFLALLGWNPGTEEEVMGLHEMAERFSLEKINKSGARFDIEKAYWFNQQYLLQKSDVEVLHLLRDTQDFPFEDYDEDFLLAVIGQMKPRVRDLNDLLPSAAFFFAPPTDWDVKTWEKKWKSPASDHWKALMEVIRSTDPFESPAVSDRVKSYMQEHSLSFGAVFPLLRIAISGVVQGPDLFETMVILGKEETTKRMEDMLV